MAFDNPSEHDPSLVADNDDLPTARILSRRKVLTHFSAGAALLAGTTSALPQTDQQQIYLPFTPIDGEAIAVSRFQNSGCFGVQAGIPTKGMTTFNVWDYGAINDGNGAGGGIENAEAIGNAIAAANSTGGGIIYFPPGIYRCDSKIRMFSNISLIGAGAGVSVIDTTNNVDNFVHEMGLSNIVIEDLGFQGSITPNQGRAIYLLRSTDIWINRCIFDDYRWGVLRFDNCSRLHITNNYMRDVNNERDGANYGLIAQLHNQTSDFVIDGNITTGAGQGSGVSIMAGSNGHITNNIIKFAGGNGTMGVLCYHACYDLVISGNYIEGAASEGVIINQSGVEAEDVIQDSRNIILSGNRIHDCNYGIAANIHGNGVYKPKQISVIGNTITSSASAGNAVGIRMDGAEDCIISNNMIVDFSMTAGAGIARGIFLLGTAAPLRMIVSANKVTNCSFGINTNAHYSTFIGNLIDKCNVGIQMQSAPYCTFVGNVLSNSVSTGLNATGSSVAYYNQVVWRNNSLSNNTVDYRGQYHSSFIDIVSKIAEFVNGGTTVAAGVSFARFRPGLIGGLVLYTITVLNRNSNSISNGEQRVAIAKAMSNGNGAQSRFEIMGHDYQHNMRIVVSSSNTETGIFEVKIQDLAGVDLGLDSQNEVEIRVVSTNAQKVGVEIYP